MITAIIIAIACIGHIALSAHMASKDGFLTTKQMLARLKKMNTNKGLPFMWHMGMWGDVFIVSPLLIIGAAMYSNTWSGIDTAGSFLIGAVASIFMHRMYIAGGKEVPEAHTHSGTLTESGVMHMLFMTIALGELILIFFFTPHIAPWFAIATSVGLGFHIFLGNHFLLGLFDKLGWFGVNKWCGRNYLASLQGWITVLVCWILLGWRCYVQIH